VAAGVGVGVEFAHGCLCCGAGWFDLDLRSGNYGGGVSRGSERVELGLGRVCGWLEGWELTVDDDGVVSELNL
jgi:hypothetical protein